MLFRYLRLNFLCWFGGIFAIVGLFVWSVAIFVAELLPGDESL